MLYIVILSLGLDGFFDLSLKFSPYGHKVQGTIVCHWDFVFVFILDVVTSLNPTVLGPSNQVMWLRASGQSLTYTYSDLRANLFSFVILLSLYLDTNLLLFAIDSAPLLVIVNLDHYTTIRSFSNSLSLGEDIKLLLYLFNSPVQLFMSSRSSISSSSSF